MQIRMSRLEIALSAPVWVLKLVAETSSALLTATENVRRSVIMELYGVSDASSADQEVQDVVAASRDAMPGRQVFKPHLVPDGAASHIQNERDDVEPMTTAQIEEAIAARLKQELEAMNG